MMLGLGAVTRRAARVPRIVIGMTREKEDNLEVINRGVATSKARMSDLETVLHPIQSILVPPRTLMGKVQISSRATFGLTLEPTQRTMLTSSL